MKHRWIALFALFWCGSVRAETPLREVSGYGRGAEEAKHDAHREALKLLRDELADRELTHWSPTAADVDRLIQGPGRAGPSLNLPGVDPRDQWILSMRMPSSESLLRHDRQSRREQWSASAMLALLGGLGLLVIRRGR